MIGKLFKYKGFTFDDNTALGNQIVLQNVDKSLPLRTSIFNKQNYHWANSSLTLWSGRLLTFTWKIFGETREKRAIGQKRLNDIIRPEGIFWENKGFYELSWMQDDWSQVKCQAKVYRMPEYSTNIETDFIIDFSFDLYVEESYFLSKEDKSNETTAITLLWWITLPCTLPAVMNWYIIITFENVPLYDVEWNQLIDVEWNELFTKEPIWAGNFPNANNLWNFEWPCGILLEAELENPRITNLSNGRFYGLNTTTTSLVIDNRNWKFIVEDEWVNVKQYRQSGSKQLFLSPWINEFVVFADNLSADTTYTITIFYNDYYINS